MNLTHLVWDTPLRQTVIICSKILRPELPITCHTTLQTNDRKKWNNCQPFLLPVSEDRHHVRLYACVTERGEGQERAIEMKQSAPYVKSDWNILAISHRLAYIIWRTYERQSSVAAGTACGECNRCDASSTLTKPMTEFPNASICECYEHACPYS